MTGAPDRVAIARLRDDAREVRNGLLADYCRRALDGDAAATAVVAEVLADAAAARGEGS